MRARGMGARVVVTEVNPVKALKAILDGFEVMMMDEAALIGDVFITATGMKDVIVRRHFGRMKDGAVVCNTGHYDVELNLTDLSALAREVVQVRPNNEEHVLEDGTRVYLLAKGRLVNLAAAEGHPSEVMDMSFANQALAMVRLAREGATPSDRAADLKRANPAFLPRNHRVEEAIAAGLSGDYAPFERLVSVLSRPFEDQAENTDLRTPPAQGEEVLQTFCGT